MLRKEQIISDRRRMERYSPVLCSAYDELFELNLSQGTCRTIFYTRDKHLIMKTSGSSPLDFEAIARRVVFPADREKFLHFFSKEKLSRLFEEGDAECLLEFRQLLLTGGCGWVQASILPVHGESERILLCYLLDIDAKKRMELKSKSLQQENAVISQNFYESFGSIYNSIITVIPQTDSAVIIKSGSRAHVQDKEFSWKKLWPYYCGTRIIEADRELVMQEFSEKNLIRLVNSGQKSKTLEARCLMEDFTYEWIEISAFVIADFGEPKLLLTTRNVNEQKLLNSIVDRFVYQNCDFFICIDAPHNAYVMFNGSSDGTPLPPVTSDSYEQALLRYNEEFVVPEDLAMCNHEMQIDRVLEVLETKAEHAFFVGVMDPVRGYTRKRLQYVYYDKAGGTILLTRTDVTHVYEEEKRKNDLLRAALEEAKTDALTGLYNQKALRGLITRALSESGGAPAALLFLDIDNFKSVNDTLGHMQGDALLRYAASRFKTKVRPSDLVGRVGGDEFLIFLPGIQKEENIRECAERLCRVFENAGDYEIDAADATCSIGIAVYPRDGEEYGALVQKADFALYDAKRRGKNQYSFYQKDMEEHSAGAVKALAEEES